MYLDQEALTITRPRSVESYAHKAAKAVLAGWLRDASANVGHDENAQFCGLNWRVNRPGPGWGVWEEYPLLTQNGAGWGDGNVWDEWGWESDLSGEAEDDYKGNRPPTYDECIKLGLPPRAILDVAIQHKGNIKHGFEIVHRNGLTPEKRAFLASTQINILVVEASWVLRQIEPPKQLRTLEVIRAW